MQKDKKDPVAAGQAELDTAFRKKCRMTWAALIKCVYEVDPLQCPRCGGTMKIVSFIEEDVVIRKILEHCGKWKAEIPRPPPPKSIGPPVMVAESRLTPGLDYSFFEQNCL